MSTRRLRNLLLTVLVRRIAVGKAFDGDRVFHEQYLSGATFSFELTVWDDHGIVIA